MFITYFSTLKLCPSLKHCCKCKPLSFPALEETPPFCNYFKNTTTGKHYLFFIISFVFWSVLIRTMTTLLKTTRSDRKNAGRLQTPWSPAAAAAVSPLSSQAWSLNIWLLNIQCVPLVLSPKLELPWAESRNAGTFIDPTTKDRLSIHRHRMRSFLWSKKKFLSTCGIVLLGNRAIHFPRSFHNFPTWSTRRLSFSTENLYWFSNQIKSNKQKVSRSNSVLWREFSPSFTEYSLSTYYVSGITPSANSEWDRHDSCLHGVYNGNTQERLPRWNKHAVKPTCVTGIYQPQQSELSTDILFLNEHIHMFWEQALVNAK